METDFKIEGLEDLESQLIKIGDGKVANRVIRSSLRKAGKVVADDAKANVAVGSGALRESIGTIARKGKGKNFQTMFVGPRIKNKAALALANAKRKKPIKGVFYGHIVELGSVRQKPRPFLRPALDKNAKNVVNTFTTALRKAVERVSRNRTT